MKTEIKRTSVLVNGKQTIQYRAKVTNWNLRYGILCYRFPAIKMLEQFDREVCWMDEAGFTQYIGGLPQNSLERAQKIIDLLLEQVQKIDDKRDRAKQAKLTKQVSYITYP